jgi:hypothetical protein
VFKKRNQSHASADSSRIGEIPAPGSESTNLEKVKDPMNLLLAQTTQLMAAARAYAAHA